MAGVLAIGVAACGDDVQVVEPTPPVPPPPPPLEASMAPASAEVAVGSSVVFAVNASGGVVGEAASWTCASSNTGIATVSVTGSGCQATGVAAGGVTITATVTKGSETANVGSQLTVTAPPPFDATIAPASQSVAVGSSVVFAVNASGGYTGMMGMDDMMMGASWTCASSDDAIATVAVTDAGCQATGVSGGEVTINVAATDGHDTINLVAQLTVTTDPVAAFSAMMSPEEAEVAIGSSVVFAINVSGGAADATAAWTCSSSDDAVATAETTDAGCQATGVAGGGVTINAAVTKGGDSANLASRLTVTAPDVGEPAFVLIAGIKDNDDNVSPALTGQINVTINVERGDQDLEELSLLVNGEVVAHQSFGVAATPALDEPAEQSAGIHTFTLSFNSAGYDDHGHPDYLNVEHTISAELEIGVDMADGTHGHETISSNAITVKFDNADGVHLTATAPSNSALDSGGSVWYGGPDTAIEITAVPVLYSGGSVSAVTMLKFCEADAATVEEAPFEFAPECEKAGKTSEGETPEFTLTVGGESISVGKDDILNGDDDIFPINLDYEGPGAPTFKPNPNGREGGWINAGVSFTSTSSRDKNAWLSKGASDTGVGGYTPQLRFAAVPRGDEDNGLTEALEAIALQGIPPGATASDSRTGSSVCFIASAVDNLGNESDLPNDEKGTCQMAGTASVEADDTATPPVTAAAATGYTKLLEDLADAEEAGEEDDITAAKAALADAGLRAGVDTTPPTAEFVGASLSSNSKTVNIDGTTATDPVTQYVLHLEDNKGLRAGEPVVDTLVYRDDDDDRDGVATTVAQQATPDDSPLYDVDFAHEGMGYYSYTAQAQDMAGNLSPEISRVALHDTTPPVSALIFARRSATEYDKTLVMADNLSVRSYSMVVQATNLPTDVGLRLNHAVVDAYNGALTQSETVRGEVELPFIAVIATADGTVAAGDAITSVTAYVADQAGNSANDVETLSISVEEDGDLETDEGVIAGTYALAVEDDDGDIDDDNSVTRSDETITLTATADVALATTVNPFADGVLFYAEVDEINTGAVGTGTRTELRLIGMVAGNAAEVDSDADSREWTYETEVSADDFYAIVGGAGDYNIRALGVNGSGVAHVLTFGDPQTLTIARR